MPRSSKVDYSGLGDDFVEPGTGKYRRRTVDPAYRPADRELHYGKEDRADLSTVNMALSKRAP